MSTRRPPHVDIFEDSTACNTTTSSDRNLENALLHALQPSSKHNVLRPSPSMQITSSPSKKSSSPLRPMSSHQLKDLKIPPPAQPKFQTDSPGKKQPHSMMHQPAALQPNHLLYPQYATIPAPPMDKENVFSDVSTYNAISPAQFGNIAQPHTLEQGYKGPAKRSADSQPMRPPTKKLKMPTQEEAFHLPEPEDMPSVVDDEQKPPHSYAELIGMAILRAPNRRLTLAQIYKWISENFKFYKSSEGGWQNSIRHNLSLNKNFIKQERPKDDPGKGNYWAIKPGEERPYLIGRARPVPRKVQTNPDGSQFQHGIALPGGFGECRPGSAPAIGNFTLMPSSSRKAEMHTVDFTKGTDEVEIMSDGTILASDPALHEDTKDDSAAMPPPPALLRSSPPPHDLGSSPPMIPRRRDTPPPELRLPSSRSGGRKRKFAGMADSGYWSSIESSAARGASRQLASEADIRGHRIKKGRAEAEIARIRSSSFDSPSKECARPRSRLGSSPTRHTEGQQPLTPAIMFKRPPKPPPSLSPNTNLRNHRNLMKNLLSPVKNFSPMLEANHWSPAFNLDTAVNLTPFISPCKAGKTPWRAFAESPSKAAPGSAFDVFIDLPETDLTARGSPERRHSRRPSLHRAATSAGILADITGTVKGNALLLPADDHSFSFSPFLAHSASGQSPLKLGSPAKLGSPLKQIQKLSAAAAGSSSLKLDWSSAENLRPVTQAATHAASNNTATELFGFDLPGSDGSEEGIDIFQDFGKIGQTAAAVAAQQVAADHRANGSPVKRTAMGPPLTRPGLMRSQTSRW